MSKLFLIALIFISGCLEIRGKPTDFSSTPPLNPPVNVIGPIIEEIEVVEEIETPEEKNIEEIRTENLLDYYHSVQSNKSLQEHLRYGLYTRDTPEIRNLSEFLWNENVFNYDSYNSYIRNFTKTESPIFDYINKSHQYIKDSIVPNPFETGDYYWKQIDANTTLSNGLGWCDDQDILFKSLMLQKGIPTQIVALEQRDKYGVPTYRHTALLVWYNHSWYKVDTVIHSGMGKWLLNLGDNDIFNITELAPLDEWYMIHTGEW